MKIVDSEGNGIRPDNMGEDVARVEFSVADDHGLYIELVTKENFGCVLHEV